MYCKNCGEVLTDGQDICLKCGVVSGKGNSYCENCGHAVDPEAAFCSNCGKSQGRAGASAFHAEERVNANPALNSEAIRSVQPRDIVKAIIFSIITCGIYGIYWFIVLTDEMNCLTNSEKDFSGGLSFVLSLVTCGIYAFIWAYKMGEKVDAMNGTKNGSSAILYLILMLLGVGIVDYALIQDAINKTIEKQ